MVWLKAYLALVSLPLGAMLPLGLAGYDPLIIVGGIALGCGLVVAVAGLVERDEPGGIGGESLRDRPRD